ncbi:hypothetical protein AC622_12130 [Bacillus sp. FJAT-27916]|uniref:hypothetical protein n=1 Tax=Bacillaceae TaxID=186817 RepID=UPI0006713DEC|nr:hypothetical protein [Bacillus sp. FJAT-27916]KMY44873.1 hypothetical protein AC622_12130 [Bacillus sp. FJAT-27916]
MRSKTKEIILAEVRQTNTVYEKLLTSLTTPVLLTVFEKLFGGKAEYTLSDKCFDMIVEELEILDMLPETTGEKITDAMLVEIFVSHYQEEEKRKDSEKQIVNEFEEGEIDEQNTESLTLDDLLDLLSLAIKDNDIIYANEIKKRLLHMNRALNKKDTSIEAS